ncbi:hypothetical protein Y032_0009g620 [Ancylostoma ceylanicum]|uniref:7TM GPCR serpentine receptor class x (Srx) domain-containing protein n=1 Tax=Ancylostoma ceylanicum TaxID=53326 RepID=A0A016VIL2_9BILA|nr:hypothetical protein Y032_0009g620 [Ancylostoma ceylanicum]
MVEHTDLVAPKSLFCAYDRGETTKYFRSASNRTHGATNKALGVTFITYGIIVEVLYVIDMFVMCKKKYRQLACYKIMIALGIYDMASISINSLLTGYFWIAGANYCTNPTLIFIAGSFVIGLWCGSCMNCFVLVINRLLDVWSKIHMKRVFGGYRAYLTLMIPLGYGMYFFLFTQPLFFNSDQAGWYFYTFTPNHSIEEFLSFPHIANNLLVVVTTCLLYVQYCRILLRVSKGSTWISFAQKSSFFQCTCICMINFACAMIFVYMEFFQPPACFVYLGHITWQLGNGFPAFVYILLNRTIQKEVLLLLRFRKPVKPPPTVLVTSSSANKRTVLIMASSAAKAFHW